MTPITRENTSLRIRDGNQGETTMRRNLARKTYASAIVAIATVLMFTTCGRRQPVYTDVSPPKLQRACQAVDEATGLEMTETDRAWCRSMMQAWYSDTSYTRLDPVDQFTGMSQLRYLQAKALDCRSTADAYELTSADRSFRLETS